MNDKTKLQLALYIPPEKIKIINDIDDRNLPLGVYKKIRQDKKFKTVIYMFENQWNYYLGVDELQLNIKLGNIEVL